MSYETYDEGDGTTHTYWLRSSSTTQSSDLSYRAFRKVIDTELGNYKSGGFITIESNFVTNPIEEEVNDVNFDE